MEEKDFVVSAAVKCNQALDENQSRCRNCRIRQGIACPEVIAKALSLSFRADARYRLACQFFTLALQTRCRFLVLHMRLPAIFSCTPQW
ncbi:MAG: hypothetical protein ABFD47_07840, partial [Armatimonadota bacterium]